MRIQLHSKTTGKTRINRVCQVSIKHKKTLLRRAAEGFFAASVIILPVSVQAGVFDGWLKTASTSTPATVAEVRADATDMPLLASNQHPNPHAEGGAEVVVDQNALVSTGPIGADQIAERGVTSGEISVYTVRDGDSLSQIAEMFGVTTNTIKWANDIAKGSDIQPGDSLVILPIAGIRHIVKSGDTISTIATKYEGDTKEILAYNQLDSASDIVVGDTLIIPGGELHAAVGSKTGKRSEPTKVTGGNANAGAGFTHPAPGAVKTQGIHGYNAVDLAGGAGSTIRAAAAGEVIIAKNGGWNGGYGNYVVIKHKNGTQTLYAHLSSLNIGVGDYVEQAQTIGGMGSTGKSTGTHLHFEVRGGRNPF